MDNAKRDSLLVVSCEHAGNCVPPEYAAMFEGWEALLRSHRGWDPGALLLAREMAERFQAPLHWDATTRLLIDLNLTIGLPNLFSAEITRPLPRCERQAIVERYYRPYRDRVEGAIDALVASGRRVVHVASHSFTPVMDGVVRRADVAWLYDPARPAERAFSLAWMAAFGRRSPALRLRRNYPYRGHSDGLPFHLRKRHGVDAYIGIELEVSQRFVEQGGAAWDRLRADLLGSMGDALAAEGVAVPPALGEPRPGDAVDQSLDRCTPPPCRLPRRPRAGPPGSAAPHKPP